MTLDSCVSPLIASNTSGGDGALGHNSLNHARAIAKLREKQLPALPQVIKPAANGDSLPFVLADIRDGSYR